MNTISHPSFQQALALHRHMTMGLITFSLAGCGFFLIGALEALSSATPDPNLLSNLSLNQIKTTILGHSPLSKPNAETPSSALSFLAIFVFSFFSIVNSLISFFDAINTIDQLGTALQLQALAIASLFLVYSILGILKDFTNSLPLPPSLLNLILLFGFVEEFLLFYLQRKDPSGVENRYFDLLLLPIAVCVFSTMMAARSPSSNLPKLSRGVGLVLQGTWFLQMGFSFFSGWIAHGCSLSEKSRGNYTIRCTGHPDYHRGRAVATLQFNCHLALMVVLAVSFYAIIVGNKGGRSESRMYMPLGAELRNLDGRAQFTLLSDEEEDDDDDEIKEEGRMEKQNGSLLSDNS